MVNVSLFILNWTLEKFFLVNYQYKYLFSVKLELLLRRD